MHSIINNQCSEDLSLHYRDVYQMQHYSEYDRNEKDFCSLYRLGLKNSTEKISKWENVTTNNTDIKMDEECFIEL